MALPPPPAKARLSNAAVTDLRAIGTGATIITSSANITSVLSGDALIDGARRLLGCLWDQGMVSCARSAARRLLLHPTHAHQQHPQQAAAQPQQPSGSLASDGLHCSSDVQLLCANPRVGWLVAQLRARGPGALEVLGRGQEGVVLLVREEGSSSRSSNDPAGGGGCEGGGGSGAGAGGGVLVKHMWHVAARVAAGGVAGHRAFLRSLPRLVPRGRWVLAFTTDGHHRLLPHDVSTFFVFTLTGSVWQ